MPIDEGFFLVRVSFCGYGSNYFLPLDLTASVAVFNGEKAILLTILSTKKYKNPLRRSFMRAEWLEIVWQ